MPIKPLFDWEQSETHVIIKIQIKGFKSECVDVFISDLLVKINAAPTYLLTLDLLHDIEIGKSSFWCDMPTVTVTLQKKQAGKIWDTLCLDAASLTCCSKMPAENEEAISESSTTVTEFESTECQLDPPKLTKEERRAFIEKRRQDSLSRAEKHYNMKLDTREKQKEVEKKRMFNQQWDIERQLRKEISTKMEIERRGEVERLTEWQHTMDEEEQKANNKRIATPADVTFLESKTPKPRNVGRSTTHITINFTPKSEVQSMLPERSRGDEDYYRKSRYRPVSVEDAPMFWKDKGDKAYKQRDWKSAMNYYSESIKRDGSFLSCIANRAACHLRMHEYLKCIADCDLAMTVLSNTPASETTQDRYKYLLKMLHTRRGAAYAWCGDLKKALQDLKCAEVYKESNHDGSQTTDKVELVEIDQQICRDAGAVEALMQSAEQEKLKQMTREQIAEKLAIEHYQERCAFHRNEAMKAYMGGNYGKAKEIFEALLTNKSDDAQTMETEEKNGAASSSLGCFIDVPGDEYDLKSRSNLCATLLHMGDHQGALTQAEWILDFCQDVAEALNEPASCRHNTAGDDDSDDEEDDMDDIIPPEGVLPQDGPEKEETKNKREFLDVVQDDENKTGDNCSAAAQSKPLFDDHVRRRRRAGRLVKMRSGHVYLLLKAYVRAGVACCGLKDYKRALEYFAAALRISPYDDDLRDDYHRIMEKARMDTLIGATKGFNKNSSAVAAAEAAVTA